VAGGAARGRRAGSAARDAAQTYTPSPVPEGVMTKTDPDSRMMRTQGQPTVHGCNAQAAVTRGQIIVAAEIAVERPDFGHLEPAVRAQLWSRRPWVRIPSLTLAGRPPKR